MSNSKPFFAYHVVTVKPMYVGQHIVFDDSNRSGVFNRVSERADIVADIYSDPEKYADTELEHHTRVALRELALEQIRLENYPEYPSRMACLYVSAELSEAEMWAEFFLGLGRSVKQLVKLKIDGNCFVGNAENCFYGTTDREENLKNSRHYWENRPSLNGKRPIAEMIVDGDIEVVEIIRTFS